jgi:hypothetical protein
MNDLLTVSCILAMLLLAAYITNQTLTYLSNNLEGMETKSSSSSSSTTKSTSTTGVGAGAASWADAIKSATTKINDSMLVSKYRKDYENVIINAEECVNASMLSALVTSPLGPDGNVTVQTLTAIKNMNDSKVALNEIMKYVDSL